MFLNRKPKDDLNILRIVNSLGCLLSWEFILNSSLILRVVRAYNPTLRMYLLIASITCLSSHNPTNLADSFTAGCRFTDLDVTA